MNLDFSFITLVIMCALVSSCDHLKHISRDLHSIRVAIKGESMEQMK